MNFKNFIKPVAAFALICGAPLLQAQVLGGGATGGLGGNLGGTLGNGMGSIGGNGQGSMGGTLGGSLDHGDMLRRHTTGAVDRAHETGGRVRDRASGTRDAVAGTATSAASTATSSAQGQVSGAANGQCHRLGAEAGGGCPERAGVAGPGDQASARDLECDAAAGLLVAGPGQRERECECHRRCVGEHFAAVKRREQKGGGSSRARRLRLCISPGVRAGDDGRGRHSPVLPCSGCRSCPCRAP